jgi:hypothetical protein
MAIPQVRQVLTMALPCFFHHPRTEQDLAAFFSLFCSDETIGKP